MASKIIQIEKKLVKNSNKELVFSNTYTDSEYYKYALFRRRF